MEEFPRPAAAQSVTEQLRAWIDWFGIGRLAASAVAVLVVAVGGFLLVRTPPPSTEALLPMSTAPSTSTVDGAPPPVVTPTTRPEPTVVHVAGAVVRPGVYELSEASRVDDAIAAAGGVTDDADTEALNLAAPVPDGSRIRVPRLGETEPPMVLSTPPVAASSAAAGGGPVDVNRAEVDELDSLPGVGPATAAAIVTERERNGPFVSVDDLLRVPGVGPAKLEALRDLVVT